MNIAHFLSFSATTAHKLPFGEHGATSEISFVRNNPNLKK
jgi:hypothetical protein